VCDRVLFNFSYGFVLTNRLRWSLEQLELVVATLLDMNEVTGGQSAALLAECATSPDVKTRYTSYALDYYRLTLCIIYELAQTGVGVCWLERKMSERHILNVYLETRRCAFSVLSDKGCTTYYPLSFSCVHLVNSFLIGTRRLTTIVILQTGFGRCSGGRTFSLESWKRRDGCLTGN
jgi:hypothetical protein